MLHCSSICYSKIQKVDVAGQTAHLFLGEVKRDRIQQIVSEDVILPWQLLTVREHYLSTQAIYLTTDFSTVALKKSHLPTPPPCYLSAVS